MGARLKNGVKGCLFFSLFLSLPFLLLSPAPADQAEPESTRIPVPNIEILDHSWKGGLTWERYNKTEATWTAKIKNNNPDPRHICLNVEFLDDERLPVFQNGKCEVVLGESEGTFSGRIMIQSPLIDEVQDTHVVALEAHQLHSYVK
ncbi:MAG TPA: hypothetical protein VIU33_02710 [Nitrospiria bacterium]